MKKTTEKKALRNIADIRADLETRANAYNAAINADDTKAAELEKLDNEISELEKELGAKLVVSRAERDVQAKFLLRNGADEVVYPEKQLAKWAAIRYSSEHILDYIELQDDHAIMEVTIPPEWMDRTIGEINIRKKYNINILALKKDGKLDMNITPDTQLCRDESMLVLGKYASIQKCFRL